MSPDIARGGGGRGRTVSPLMRSTGQKLYLLAVLFLLVSHGTEYIFKVLLTFVYLKLELVWHVLHSHFLLAIHPFSVEV